MLGWSVGRLSVSRWSAIRIPIFFINKVVTVTFACWPVLRIWIHWFRIRIQNLRLSTGPDPDPGFDDRKWKKIELNSIEKREHPQLQNMKFLNFFSIFVVNFCPVGSGFTDLIESGSRSETLLLTWDLLLVAGGNIVYAGDVRVSQPQDFSRIVSRPPSSISMDKVPYLPVLRIHDIFVWIRIRGSMRLTNGSGSCYFRHWPARCQQKNNSF